MSTDARSAVYEAWVARAREVAIEEVARRGIKLTRNRTERAGPCPRCVGLPLLVRSVPHGHA
jgi:hypothetical protein